MAEFKGFTKIPRLSREIIITEKIDGTNAQIYIGEDGEFLIGSRTRWIIKGDDNYGFVSWAYDNKDELMKLGVGSHFGEWWGRKIQRGYDMNERVFSLFNVERWSDPLVRPSCCGIVPVLYRGPFSTTAVDLTIEVLKTNGSVVAPEYMNPEGVVVYHTAANMYFKKTIVGDDKAKTQQ